jgi:hypothetical protein
MGYGVATHPSGAIPSKCIIIGTTDRPSLRVGNIDQMGAPEGTMSIRGDGRRLTELFGMDPRKYSFLYLQRFDDILDLGEQTWISVTRTTCASKNRRKARIWTAQSRRIADMARKYPKPQDLMKMITKESEDARALLERYGFDTQEVNMDQSEEHLDALAYQYWKENNVIVPMLCVSRAESQACTLISGSGSSDWKAESLPQSSFGRVVTNDFGPCSVRGE